MILYILAIINGSARISSGFFMPVICRSDISEKNISITFDDGPLAGQTSRILDILKINNVPATFFCIGKNIAVHKEIIKRMDQEGHLIGNHSYSHHFFFDLFSRKRIARELKDTTELVQSISQKRIRYFRPPYGVTTPNIAKVVGSENYHAIGWSVRTLDTVITDRNKLLRRSTENLKPGDIVLFHDTLDTTVLVLQEFIDKVRNNGFRIVRLDKLINIPAYE